MSTVFLTFCGLAYIIHHRESIQACNKLKPQKLLLMQQAAQKHAAIWMAALYGTGV